MSILRPHRSIPSPVPTARPASSPVPQSNGDIAIVPDSVQDTPAQLAADTVAAVPVTLDLSSTSKTSHVMPRSGAAPAAPDTVIPAVDTASTPAREPTAHEQLAQRYIAGGYLSLCFIASLLFFVVSSIACYVGEYVSTYGGGNGWTLKRPLYGEPEAGHVPGMDQR